MGKRKGSETKLATHWALTLERISHYVTHYRPDTLTIPGVTRNMWKQLNSKKLLPGDILAKLQFQSGVQLVPRTATANDTYVRGLLQTHLVPKLVCFTIMDYLDSTADRCGRCNGTIQSNERTKCSACGDQNRLVHTECNVAKDSRHSVCQSCREDCVWCVDCDSWIQADNQSTCSCGEPIHRDCTSVTVDPSLSVECTLCESLHHLKCFSADKQVDGENVCDACWQEDGVVGQCGACKEYINLNGGDRVHFSCEECDGSYHNTCRVEHDAPTRSWMMSSASVCDVCYREDRPTCTECGDVVMEDNELTACLGCDEVLHQTDYCVSHGRCTACYTEETKNLLRCLHCSVGIFAEDRVQCADCAGDLHRDCRLGFLCTECRTNRLAVVTSACQRVGVWFHGGTDLGVSYVRGCHRNLEAVMQAIVLARHGLYDGAFVTQGAAPTVVLQAVRLCRDTPTPKATLLRYFRKKDRYFSFREDTARTQLQRYVRMVTELWQIRRPRDPMERRRVLVAALDVRGCTLRSDSVVCGNFIRGKTGHGAALSVAMIVDIMTEARFRHSERAYDASEEHLYELADETGEFYPGIRQDARQLALSAWQTDLGEMPLLFPWE